MTTTIFELAELTGLAMQFQPPCEFEGVMRDGPGSCPNVAEWILFREPCCIGAPNHALACTRCKERRLTGKISVQCHTCGMTWMPANLAYTRIEPLNWRA